MAEKGILDDFDDFSSKIGKIRNIDSDNESEEKEELVKKIEKISQEHLHELIFSEELSWQAILYDLINTEQLDPWDINLSVLSNKYLEKIKELEEANFFVSSKVLFAASLLLRFKSEILLNKYLRSLDDILFGKKADEKYQPEKIILEEGEIPELIPKTPMPRYKKVSLQELIAALNKAINTETRRIRKEIVEKTIRRRFDLDLPKTRINLKDKIKEIYSKLVLLFKKKERVSFSELAGKDKADKINTFVPLLHLDTQQKVWLEQHEHFGEIWVLLYNLAKGQAFSELREEIEIEKEELDNEQIKRIEEINKDFENPLGDFFDLVR